MSFSFGAAPEAPMPIQVARILIWIQASFLAVMGLGLMLITLFLNSAETHVSVSVGPASVTGASAVMTGLVYLGLGVVFFWVGARVVKPTESLKMTIAVLEIVYAGATILMSGISGASIIVLIMVIAVIALLYLPAEAPTLTPEPMPEKAPPFDTPSPAPTPAASDDVIATPPAATKLKAAPKPKAAPRKRAPARKPAADKPAADAETTAE